MTIRTELTDLGLRAMNGIHRSIMRLSGGRLGWTIGTMPVVELHTTGRTSGERRSTMLTAPVHGEGRYVLVASKGGDDRQPNWYLNLVAEPNVELTIKGETFLMRARTATLQEKADLWPRITATYSGYRTYQQNTSRDIPVVICEPR